MQLSTPKYRFQLFMEEKVDWEKQLVSCNIEDLVETRFFPGERGRGGNIMKLRICYEKEPVKRHIDLRVAKNKK